MNPHPLTPAIAAIESRIQDLYREKERLEMTRDAEVAPALIAYLLAQNARFVLDHCHHTRANIVFVGDGDEEKAHDAIRAYIGGGLTDDTRPLSGDAAIYAYQSETPYITALNINGESDEEVVGKTLAVLKALGIPKDRLSVGDYEQEVADYERNRARVQVDLDKVRALVAAY